MGTTKQDTGPPAQFRSIVYGAPRRLITGPAGFKSLKGQMESVADTVDVPAVGGSMADIFLSYSSRDLERAEMIVRALESEGFSVFWDRELVSGEKYSDQIEQRLATAKVALVLWSSNSVQSSWVVDEAIFALEHTKLVPVLIEHVRPPLGLSTIQSLELLNWNGERQSPDWRLLIDTLRRFLLDEPSGSLTDRKKRSVQRGTYDLRRSAVAESVEEAGTEIVFAPDASYKKPWGAGSTAIFIAHASGDKLRIKPILEVLARAGFSIWIDKPHLLMLDKRLKRRVRGIQFGAGDWKEQIRKAANRANIVLAFWSDDAVDARREQFYYEVYMGLIQRKLCQCRIDPIAPAKIGMPFTFDQIADLSGFEPGVYHPELDFMMGGLPQFRRRLL